MRHQKSGAWPHKLIGSILSISIAAQYLFAPMLLYAVAEGEPTCGRAQHEHDPVTCYTTTQTERAVTCTNATLGIHQHTSSCYDADGDVSCGYADFVVHSHDGLCYSIDADTVLCQLEEIQEHEHTDACWHQEQTLTCQEEEALGHLHIEECYAYEEELICEILESAQHYHGESCFSKTAVCGDDAHDHTDACFSSTLLCELPETDGHTHEAACYKQTETLVCEEEVRAPGHIHDEASCYRSEPVLDCTNPEVTIHKHDETCYTEATLTCGFLETAEHQHADACITENTETIESETPLCGYEEHIHEEACYEQEDDSLQQQAQVEAVISLLDTYPTMDEVYENMDAFGNDADSAKRYCEELVWAMQDGYDAYMALPEELQSQVTNAEDFLLLWDELNTLVNQEAEMLSAALDSFGNNVYKIDLVDAYDESANVIRINNKKSNLNTWSTAQGVTIDYSLWYEVRVEKRAGYYCAIQSGSAASSMATQVDDAFLLLLKKSYVDGEGKYLPYAHWPEGANGNHSTASNGDRFTVTSKYITIYPKSLENGVSGSKTANANGVPDAETVPKSASISFQLFDYSTNINKLDGSFRPISSYFTFRGVGTAIPNPSQNTTYDQDGFTKNHATVERTLDENGYPVLAFDRYANGKEKDTPKDADGNELFTYEDRKIDYLFGGRPDPEVTVYTPNNTILQYNEETGEYWYDSALNAVDYNTGTNTFYVRGYTERNATTASYGKATEYFDFLPFNYTNGVITGTHSSSHNTYNLDTAEVDYWFGMMMSVDFMQLKNGMFNREEMIFNFSGDDDVWVFIDNVLVLDLGGTHGAVTGTINFATGEVEQYLDWNGTTGVEGTTSFDTSIYDCFTKAGATPNGGWKQNANGDYILNDYTNHKLKFFYMERGAAVANCSFSFNLPILSDNTLSISKDIGAYEDETVDPLGNPDYLFQVLRTNGPGDTEEHLFIGANTPYVVYEGSTLVADDKETDENGIIRLKRGQRAIFELPENSGEYYCREIIDPALADQYIEVDVNGSVTTFDGEIMVDDDTFTGTSSQSRDMSDGDSSFEFNNKVTIPEIGALTIIKDVRSEGEVDVDTGEFQVYVEIDGEPIKAGTHYTLNGVGQDVLSEGFIILEDGDTVVIPYILVGSSYMVQEQFPNGGAEEYFVTYQTSFSGATISEDEAGAFYVSGTIAAQENVEITVLNNQDPYRLELPNTGGIGTGIVYASGLALLLYAAERTRKGDESRQSPTFRIASFIHKRKSNI